MFAIISSETSFGFNREFRVALIADAIYFCPQELKVLLKKNQDELIDGMLFVSRNRKSFHMSDIEDIIKYYYNHLVNELEAGKLGDDNTIRSFGLTCKFCFRNNMPWQDIFVR